MSDISYTPITPRQYTKLLQAMMDDKVSAVVLGKSSYVVDDKGVVSVVGQSHISVEQLTLFKTWLIKQYGHTI